MAFFNSNFNIGGDKTIENSMSKYDNCILEIISNEMIEIRKKTSQEQETQEPSKSYLLPEVIKNQPENNKHMRHKSSITKIQKENSGVNKSRITTPHVHKISQTGYFFPNNYTNNQHPINNPNSCIFFLIL